MIEDILAVAGYDVPMLVSAGVGVILPFVMERFIAKIGSAKARVTAASALAGILGALAAIITQMFTGTEVVLAVTGVSSAVAIAAADLVNSIWKSWRHDKEAE